MGGVQAVVGIVLAVAASVAIGTGAGAVVGVPLLAYSADLAAAGINQAATGEYTNTFFFEGTKKTAKGLGASEETANNIAIGTDIVVGATLTGGSSNTKYIGTIPKVVAGGSMSAKKIDGLIKVGNALDKGGFTAVGRALQKQGSRTGSIFPKVTGNAAAINAQGEAVLKGILTNPNATTVTRHHARFGNIMDVQILGGQGARFSADGKTFIHFLEP